MKITYWINVLRFNPRLHMLSPHLRTHMGGGVLPHAILPLIEIELWDENETTPWDVLSPTVPVLISSSHILTSPGRVKVKMIAILRCIVFR